MPKPEKQMAVMTMVRAEMIGDVWREVGAVVEVSAVIAKRWVDAGYAIYGGDPSAAKPVVSELGDFPSADLFAAAGFTSLVKIKTLITEQGDAWPKSVKGMTKALAAKVSAALEAMAAAESTELQEKANTEG